MGSISYLIGHVWNEIGGEIADFSASDWQAETDRMYTNLFGACDQVVDHALPIIADLVDELRLCERVADF
jgi:hypothetical protein